MKRIRMRALPYVATFMLLSGVVSTVGVIALPRAALAGVPSGNEASVPTRPLAAPPTQHAEDPSTPLPAPVWPVVLEATAALSSMAAGALTPGAPAGLTKSLTSSVVSFGPAPAGVRGPLQAAGVAVAPAGVDVRVLDRAAIAAAGGQALGVVVNRSDGVAAAGPVQVSISYAKFASAFGGDYAGRLRLVEFPACSLTTPAVQACSTPTYVNAVNDPVVRTITGTVDANPDPATAQAAGGTLVSAAGVTVAAGGDVVTLLAAGSSDAGDYRATDLKPSGSWSVSPGSGAFTYRVPVVLPPPAEGVAPGLSLDYNSQTVDGMTSATNNQASQVGLGWDLTSAYVERRYRNCQVDGQGPIEEDLCWYSPGGTADPSGADYEIVLGGVSSGLVPDATTAGRYHLSDDPGWLVQHHTGASNSDDTGEYWQVFTPDGSAYYFGWGVDAKTGAASNSVETVPVFGNDTGEPCHSSWSDVEDNRVPCQQAWRWNLDRVIDPNEVSASYHYTKETNFYRSVEGPNISRSYDRAAELTEIDYGWASQITGANYTDKVVLGFVGRCVTRMAEADPLRNGTSNTGVCPSITTTPSDYPDVPTDKMCDGSGGCASPVTSYAPVFFSTQMLWDITTYTLTTTGTASQVGHYQLKHGLPDAGSGQFLWFDYLQRQGFGGTGASLVLPVINFDGGGLGDLDNVVGSTSLVFRRVTSIYTDLGGVISISYGLPDACSSGSLPSEPFRASGW